MLLIAIIWLLLIIVVTQSASSGSRRSSSHGPKPKARVYVRNEDRILNSASGYSADDAIRTLFDKLDRQVSSFKKPDAIQSRIDQMRSVLSDQGNMMSSQTRAYCNHILCNAQDRHRQAIREEEILKHQRATLAAQRKEQRQLARSISSVSKALHSPSSVSSLVTAVRQARELVEKTDASDVYSELSPEYDAIVRFLSSADEEINRYLSGQLDAICRRAADSGSLDSFARDVKRFFRDAKSVWSDIPSSSQEKLTNIMKELGVRL